MTIRSGAVRHIRGWRRLPSAPPGHLPQIRFAQGGGNGFACGGGHI